MNDDDMMASISLIEYLKLDAELKLLKSKNAALVDALQALLYASDSPELITKARAALAKAGV